MLNDPIFDDTPNITLLVRSSSTAISVACVERPEWNAQESNFARAMFKVAKKAQESVQDPFGGGIFREDQWISNLRNDQLPSVLTIRFAFSPSAWEYVVTFDELPRVELFGRLSTLSAAIWVTATRLNYYM